MVQETNFPRKTAPSVSVFPQHVRIKTPMVPLADCDLSLQVIPMGSRSKDSTSSPDALNQSTDIPKELQDFIESVP